MLSSTQKIGLKYYDDFQVRIPRETVSKIYKTVQVSAKELFGSNLVEVECCGSYRRGKQTCGDVDILITRTD
jgi:DNA polymerase lambda